MQFRTKLIAPSPDVADLVHTFYIIETDSERIEEAIPAYSAQMFVVVRGRLEITHAEGRTAQSAIVTINAPQLRSAPCVLHGPVMLVGASLTHVSWQRLSNLPADTVHDQLIPAPALLSAEQLASLEAAAAACREGRMAPDELCQHLTA
ncbi:MAG: hypothetical protein EAY70_04210, partial [Sphingomonadales bacterium]